MMRRAADTAITATTSRAVVTRHTRRARWYHAGVYVVTILLMSTGWWLLGGGEGDPSLLARLLGRPDTELHTLAGWIFVSLAPAGAMLGFRGTLAFVGESIRYRRGDLAWFRSWPAALLTGRFAPHDGSFDPGQRVANLVMSIGLLALAVSGAGLAAVHGGDAFVWLLRVHKWSTYIVTPVIVGHVLVAGGLAPGYRGVWRSMHWGGRLPAEVARRLWPRWTERRHPNG
jgi:cytochrome b subunit of formate dehydrogenase